MTDSKENYPEVTHIIAPKFQYYACILGPSRLTMVELPVPDKPVTYYFNIVV